MNGYIWIALFVLASIEFAIFRIQDKKQRYIALSVLGIALMVAIFIGTIIFQIWPASIWMGIVLCVYCIGLIWVWNRYIK